MDREQPSTLPFDRRRFRHVFVLCTGRCGSLTFAKACGHFTNYTAGHETNRAKGSARLTYPQYHIEADNRLAWFLGGLEERYGDDAYYIHLIRDEARVAMSYDRRWHHHGSLIRAFNEGICGHPLPGPEAAADLAATVNANIRGFLRDKTHVLVGDIEDAAVWFPRFIRDIGASCSLEAVLAEFAHRHNSYDPVGSGATDARRSRESLPIVRLTEQKRRLLAEKARLRSEATKAKRLAWAMATPWLLAAAPITLPLAVYAVIKHGAEKKPRHMPSPPRWIPKFFRHKRGRTLVYDAFLAYRASGPDDAEKLLTSAGRTCPPGAVALFRAMAADSDTDWLTASNAWAATAALPEIRLQPGPGPRFHRIELAECDPVLAGEKVSVIMPAFNARQTITQAARSILSQSYRNVELIIVDDASTDGTAELAERIAAGDTRVRVLCNPCNVGPYVSKNRGLLLATGRYVTGHDADDIATPTRLADQLEPIRKDATCLATYASMIRIDQEGRFSYPTKVGSYSYDGIARRAMISLLIDREVLLSQVGFWDSVRFGADSEMLARVTALLGSRLREVRKVVMLCLDANGSLTNNAHHGVSAWEGVSPIRQAYRDAWADWHAATRPEQRRLPFPHVDRLFPAPEDMLVPREVLATLPTLGMASKRRVA